MALQHYEVDIDNLNKEDREQFLKLVSQSKIKKAWKPKLNEQYWCIGNGFDCNFFNWVDDSTDNRLYEIGNCFRTEEDVRFALERLKVIAELKRYTEGNNTKDLDWSDDNNKKFYLAYSTNYKEIYIDYSTITKRHDVYFSSSKIAQAAIDTIGEDRLKKYYFNMTDDKEGVDKEGVDNE